MEIQLMNGMKAYHTIQVLRKWFVQFGFSIHIVSNNVEKGDINKKLK